MAFGTVASAAIYGIHVEMIHIETDVSNGLPVYNMVGYLSSEVKEAGERVRTALKNSGFEYPIKRIIVNLSPATIRKRGASFDLPIAISIMVSAGQIPQENVDNILVVGELGLDGKLLRVNGLLAIIMEAKKAGITKFIAPMDNYHESNLVEGMEAYNFNTLVEVHEFLTTRKYNIDIVTEDKDRASSEDAGDSIWPEGPKGAEDSIESEESKGARDDNRSGKSKGRSGLYYDFSNDNVVDFRDIYGQKAVKRAAEIAVSGGHNLLLIGPPGSGKSMIAKGISTILPPLDNHESMEVTKIYSIMGQLKDSESLIVAPPFRSIHHTITKTTLVGGGNFPTPGEITLSHGGILYLDELPEFSRAVLEVLRQPLEDKSIQISRTTGSCHFPADFILICAMNPCPCGMYPDLEKCTCSQSQISNYMGKISQPFLDRIDICIEAPKIDYIDLKKSQEEEGSFEIRERVIKVREIQRQRYLIGTALTNKEDHEQEGKPNNNFKRNAQLTPLDIKKYCYLDSEGEKLMEQAYDKLSLTARSYHKILKVARTIADIDGQEHIAPRHLREAIGYRTMDKKYWR